MVAASKDQRELSELLLPLHEAALEPARWRNFLEGVGRRLKANHATLILRSPAIGESGLLYTWGAHAEGTSAYTSRYFALDPFVQLPEGEVVTLHEFLGRERIENSAFYREYMQPVDSVYILGVDLREPGRYSVRFRVSRSRRAGDFGAAARRFCELLVPHLRASIRTHVELDLVRTERSIYADAMADLTLATLVLDESARVIHANALATRILGKRDGISLADGAIAFDDPVDAQRYQGAFMRALEAGRTDSPGIVEALRVRQPRGGGHLGVIVRPGGSRLREPDAPLAGAVAVFLSDESDTRDASTASVRKLFGLTEKEAQLALSIANGHSLQETAGHLGISLNTARAHLRAIYAKTGIDRQAKLVRAILGSVAALG